MPEADKEGERYQAGTPQAASDAANKAVPTGPSVSAAATLSRGTKKPVIRPMLVAAASDRAASASAAIAARLFADG